MCGGIVLGLVFERIVGLSISVSSFFGGQGGEGLLVGGFLVNWSRCFWFQAINLERHKQHISKMPFLGPSGFPKIMYSC